MIFYSSPIGFQVFWFLVFVTRNANRATPAFQNTQELFLTPKTRRDILQNVHRTPERNIWLLKSSTKGNSHSTCRHFCRKSCRIASFIHFIVFLSVVTLSSEEDDWIGFCVQILLLWSCARGCRSTTIAMLTLTKWWQSYRQPFLQQLHLCPRPSVLCVSMDGGLMRI